MFRTPKSARGMNGNGTKRVTCSMIDIDESNELTSTRILGESTTRILVVDDDEMIRNLLNQILTPKGYKVDLSEGSGSALENLIDYKYNIVLLDVNLPGISGHEILKYCKKNHPFTEIIMITGNPAIDIAVNTVKDGAFDFIEKPFTVENILNKVDEALKHQRKKFSTTTNQMMNMDQSMNQHSLPPEYKVIRTIGSGNMGIVMLVEKDKRKFAMKVLRRDGSEAAFEGRVKRFLREAKILSKIESPHVVKIYDYGYMKNKDVPYYIMEYIRGKGLIQLVKDNSLTLQQKLHIISQVASALEIVHRHGILHRDIKPSNVLVEENYNAKLMDFGVARVEDSSLTMHDEVLGSPAYMAPECFDRRRRIDNRTDIFSLGILSYELLTGEKPFKGETVSEMMAAIQKTRPIEPMKINSDIPAGAQDMLAKMLHKNPKERFQTAIQVCQAIHSFADLDMDIGKNITTRLFKAVLFSGGRVWE